MFEKLIQATISSLGYLEGDTYFPEPDCLVGIHDLIRFLHKDKDTLDARRICLVNNIVRNDLVPLLLAKDTDENVFDSALRLTVNLCQPIIVAFGGKMPESEDIIQVYHDAESNLVSTLAAFTKVQIFEKFANILETFFAKEWADRNESDKTNVDRIIMLVRYIFAIGMECPMTVERPKIDPLVKERMIRAFLRSKMPSVLMKVGADRMERELSVHIMGIFSLMLRSIDCESVAAFKSVKALDEKEQEEEEMRTILERDRSFLKARRSQLSTSRNHLGANYILKNAALNPEKDLLVQKSNINTSLDNLRSRKRNYRTTKRSRVRDVMESAFKPNTNAPADLCQLLHEFCTEFITNAFDKVMKATREVAFMSHKAGGVLAYSDVNYFFLAEYVLQFIRMAKMPIEKASSIFSREFFHHVISQCETYFEMMKTDKYRITSFAVRAQHAISAYKEMMLLLNSLAKSERFMDKEMFSYMTQTIYYNEEYREFPYLTLNRLQPQGMTRTLLNDLVIASHYYIATMDHIIKTGELQIVAKRKRIAKQRKKKAKQLIKETEERTKADQMNEEQLNELWDQLKAEVNDVLSGVIDANEEVSPINILLKVDDSKHQIFAVLQIQRALRTRRVCDAVGLYKAARDLWPDAAFGDYSNTVEQDIPVLQEIYRMDLADIAVEYDDLMKTVYGANTADQDANAEEEHISVSDDEKKKTSESNDEKSEDEEDQPKYKIAEINFDINDYIRNFTKPDVIHWYIFALKDFEMNSIELNRAIVKMLYRIAFQLEMPSKLYLASLFRILTCVNVEVQKLPKEVAKKHQFYDIYKLGHHLLQKFFGHFKERGAILICELLFSKNNRECTEIEHGYGTANEQNNSTLLWTEELEAEMEKLYHQYQSMEEKPEGISLIEYIQHNLAKERTPRQIQRQLKRMGFEFERAKKPRKPKVEGEKRKSKKSKKHIDEDQLFASRTPSPSHSDSESEAESSTNEDSGDEENESHKSETPTEHLEIVGIEQRLQIEETKFISQDHEFKSQRLELDVQNTVTVLTTPMDQSQDMSWHQFDSVPDGDSNLGELTTKKKQKSKPPKQKSPKRKYRSLLKQPIETETLDDNEPDENAMPSPSNHQQHSFRRILDSDDEMDNLPVENQSSNDGIVDSSKADKRRIIGSDDEEEGDEPVVSQKKRQKIADEDDE